MLVEQRIAGHMQNFTYLVADPATQRAVIVDPSFDATVALKLAEERGFTVEAVLDTNEHFDHCMDNALAKARTGAKVMAHRLADVPEKDRDLEDGELLRLGGRRDIRPRSSFFSMVRPAPAPRGSPARESFAPCCGRDDLLPVVLRSGRSGHELST